MKLSNLKNGDFFTKIEILEPKENQVFIKLGKVKDKKDIYEVCKFDDINDIRFMKDREIFTSFTF